MYQLYDLAGADRTMRFSPFCWRAKLALKHKGQAFEDIDVAFTEKDKIAFSGQKLVPILVDGNKVVTDSWAIALHLDETLPDQPALMACAQSRAHTFLIKNWVETAINPAILKIVILDLVARLAPVDQAYFRETREARFGMTLEELSQGAQGVPALQQALQPARITLAQSDYLGGENPSFADILLMSAFLWGRSSSDISFIEIDDTPIRGWLDRMQARYELSLRV